MNCPKCGTPLETVEEGRYRCPGCNAKFAVKKPLKPLANDQQNANEQAPADAQSAVNEQAPAANAGATAEQTAPAAAENEAPATEDTAVVNEAPATEDNSEANEAPGEDNAEAESEAANQADEAPADEASAEEEPAIAQDEIDAEQADNVDDAQLEEAYVEPDILQPVIFVEQNSQQGNAKTGEKMSVIDETASIRDAVRPLVKKNLGFCTLTSILLSLVKIGSLFFMLYFGPLLVGGAVNSSFAGFWVDVASDKCEGTKSSYRGFNHFMPALWLNLLIALVWLIPLTVIIILFVVSIRVVWFMLPIIFILLLFSASFINSLSQYAFCALNAGVSQRATELFTHAYRTVSKNYGKILALKCSFIGWWLLCILTLGILTIYVRPYYQTALARQYLEITNQLPEAPQRQQA